MSVNTIEPDRKRQVLSCYSILREVPRKRYVYKAVWDGREVIAKVFLRSINARRRLRREWRGLEELMRRELNVPKPFFYGTGWNGQWVMVSQRITDSATALELYQQDSSETGRFNVLSLVVRELARLNSKGVLQKDVHLGNFLVSGEQVFALDVGQMAFYAHPLSRNRSLRQLAAVLCFSSSDDSIQNLCRQYTEARNWDFDQQNNAAVREYMDAHLKTAMCKGLKKTLRTSKRYVQFKKNGFTGVFDRMFYEQWEPSTFTSKIDELMDNGTILKNGNTCYVSRINYGDRELVVKRYNYKGFLYSLRNSIKGSRARRCWLYGHLLGMLGIETPKPLGFFEQHKGPIVRRSYILTEFVKGQKLSDILQQDDTSREKRKQVKLLLEELLAKMHNNLITHGDLKPTNVLLTDNGLVVTDLDSMKSYKWSWLCRVNRSKDVARLCRYNEKPGAIVS